jgi:hypothetical protein
MPWKVTTLVWPALVAALLPLDLSDLLGRLPHIIARLAALDAERGRRAPDDRSRPRQIDDFRSRYASHL